MVVSVYIEFCFIFNLVLILSYRVYHFHLELSSQTTCLPALPCPILSSLCSISYIIQYHFCLKYIMICSCIILHSLLYNVRLPACLTVCLSFFRCCVYSSDYTTLHRTRLIWTWLGWTRIDLTLFSSPYLTWPFFTLLSVDVLFYTCILYCSHVHPHIYLSIYPSS